MMISCFFYGVCLSTTLPKVFSVTPEPDLSLGYSSSFYFLGGACLLAILSMTARVREFLLVASNSTSSPFCSAPSPSDINSISSSNSIISVDAARGFLFGTGFRLGLS